MPACCFFDVQEVTDPEALNEYRSKVRATVEHHGGRYVLVGGELEAVEGDWRPTFPVLIESSQAWSTRGAGTAPQSTEG
jgi:uncharacterized protein (DUF1330 family)